MGKVPLLVSCHRITEELANPTKADTGILDSPEHLWVY